MGTCKFLQDFLLRAPNSHQCSNLSKNLNKPAEVLKDTNQRISSHQFCTDRGMLHLQERFTAENTPLSSAKITILCLKFKGFQLKWFEQIKLLCWK